MDRRPAGRLHPAVRMALPADQLNQLHPATTRPGSKATGHAPARAVTAAPVLDHARPEYRTGRLSRPLPATRGRAGPPPRSANHRDPVAPPHPAWRQAW
jgi:hypothetical protein